MKTEAMLPSFFVLVSLFPHVIYSQVLGAFAIPILVR